jgi:hypothetical protein
MSKEIRFDMTGTLEQSEEDWIKYILGPPTLTIHCSPPI